MSTFALDLQKFAEKTGKKADLAVGAIVARVAEEIDSRSPVGDATYWTHPAPKGYVGGRFRANWQLGVDAVPGGAIDAVDPSGTVTLSAINGTIPAQASGHIYSLVNNLPYAQRIEEGRSRQAPTGLVGLTAIMFRGIVDQAVRALPA